MGHSVLNKLVVTVKDRCRVCYTCVRECPVKAIKINNGQAEVISERCIGCGNCVKVCSQGAKVFLDSTTGVESTYCIPTKKSLPALLRVFRPNLPNSRIIRY